MDERAKANVMMLRETHPDWCTRPNSGWSQICIRDLGHEGACGWERDENSIIHFGRMSEDLARVIRRFASYWVPDVNAGGYNVWTRAGVDEPMTDRENEVLLAAVSEAG